MKRKCLKLISKQLLGLMSQKSHQIQSLAFNTGVGIAVLSNALSHHDDFSLIPLFSLLPLALLKLFLLGVMVLFTKMGRTSQKRLEMLFHFCFSVSSWATIAIQWATTKDEEDLSPSHLVLLEISLIEQLVSQKFSMTPILIRLSSILIFFGLETTMLFLSIFSKEEGSQWVSLIPKFLLLLVLIRFHFKEPKPPANPLKEISKESASQTSGREGIQHIDSMEASTRRKIVEKVFMLTRCSTLKKTSLISRSPLQSEKDEALYQREPEMSEKQGLPDRFKAKHRNPGLNQHLNDSGSQEARKIPSIQDFIKLNEYSQSNDHFKGDESMKEQENNNFVDWLPLPSFLISLELGVESVNGLFRHRFAIPARQEALELVDIDRLLGEIKRSSYQGSQKTTIKELRDKAASGELTSKNFPVFLRSKVHSEANLETHELDIWLKLFSDDAGSPFIMGQVLDSSNGSAVVEMRDEVMNSFGHEFRTPLNIIKATLFFLIKSKGKGESESEEFLESYLKPAYESANLILSLISSIENYSAIQMGNYEKKPSKKNISSFLDSVLNFFKAKAKEKQVTIVKIIETGSPEMWITDWNLVFQVLIQLILNSLKFSRPLGTVTVKCRIDRKGSLLFSVEDTGIGMTNEELKRLESYLKFDCTERKISKNSSGIGIGMVIIRTALIALNTTSPELKIVSNESGSLFEFKLDKIEKKSAISLGNLEVSFDVLVSNPTSFLGDSFRQKGLTDFVLENSNLQNSIEMSVPDELPAKTGMNSPPIFILSQRSFRNSLSIDFDPNEDQKCHCRRAMVVDDEKANRMILLAHLKRFGLWDEFLEASNGEEALALFKRLPSCGSIGCSSIQVAFVDINMPIMDGGQLCKELREYSSKKLKEKPIIFCYSAYDYSSKHKTMGFDGFLPKPFQSQDLEGLLDCLEEKHGSKIIEN